MADINKNNLQQDDESQKNKEELITLHRPKHIKKKHLLDLERSKSAPIEETNDGEQNDDYLSSYNYYIYYNSIKPRNPHMPKPTYKPNPNLAFIKESQKDEEDEDLQESGKENNFNQIDELNEHFNKFVLEDNANDNNNNNNMNENLFSENHTNKNENNPTTLDYFTNGGNQNMNGNWNAQNNNLNGFNMGMGNMMGMNLVNPLIGVDKGAYNMYNMKMNNQNNNIKINKKGGNNNLFSNNQMFIQNQNMYNNLYNVQGNAFLYPQNPMLNMNYFNDPNLQMQMMQNYRNNRNVGMNMLIQNDMNNMHYPMGGFMNMNYKNMNNLNKFQQKKNKKMENFVRKNSNEPNNVEEIIEKAVQLSKDHSGSRLVQKTYEEGNKDIKDKIFEKFKPEILTLSKDIFGNYAIQKVLESKDGEKDEEKNNFIMESLKGKIYDLSIHMYGCRVIQQLICAINEKYLSQITLELKDHFAKLIEDQNGNHVIQKLIERLKPGVNNGIYDVVYNNIVYLSKHQYGCRVIQTLLKQCNEEQKKKMLDEICKEVKELSEDQYGNYIIQYILEHNKGNNLDIIYEKLKGNIYDFSLHKYASNVIEKALHYGDEKQRKNIIDEIIQKDDQIQESLLSMVKDKFGNYVVQKIIEFSDEKTRENIIKRIISSQSLKKKDGFSKHVINFIEKLNSSNNGNNDKNTAQK